MAKRRQQGSEDSDFEHCSDSSESDASYSAKTRTKSAGKGKTQGPKSHKRRKTTTAEPSLVGTESIPHSRRAHVVQNSEKARTALLTWYKGVHDSRGMPWRKRFDARHTRAERAQRAYEVWVSEIMLQQTQVATVIPYYNRFPTITDLAAADIEEVNSLWKGLGYYSRASRLLAGAQKVAKELGGLLPDNAKDMEAKIPGIGRYSAGAICSIAYGEKAPVLDGNVHRLLSRFLMLHANPKSKATLDILWTAAEAMVNVKGTYTDEDYQNPGDINQALIELGSTVCKVQNPSCGTCPLNDYCGAYQKASSVSHSSKDIPDIEDLCTVCEPLPAAFDVTLLPMKAGKKKAREETDIVNVVEWRRTLDSDERWVLLVKRPEKGLLAGLYEFPTLDSVPDPDSKLHLTEGPMSALSNVLASPVRPLESSAKKDAEDGEFADCVRISEWVLLIGGDCQPAISTREPVVSAKKGTKGKQKGKSNPAESTVTSEGAKWVAVDEVEHANISTGMVKVWTLTKSHWDSEV